MSMFTPLPDGHFQPSRIDEQQAALSISRTKAAEMLTIATIASILCGAIKVLISK